MTSIVDRGDAILEHYGVKGMKWGVRKDGSTSSTTTKTSRVRRKASDVTVAQKPGKYARSSGGKRQTASSDAVRVAAARQYAKKSTTDSLSTKQLQEAVNRMNLEIQYDMVSKKIDRRSRGQRFVQTITGNKENRKLMVSASTEAAKIFGESMKKS